ncbi:MAG: pantetheine-phosphate adenylyltransferase [Alloprevotella sp.]|nr:pantetheine-phosphate adenylyltransferase [Alloprevotella sp.]
MKTNKKIALFPGSFDPFTVGHASIIERALPMFDEIIIGIGVNDQKQALFSPEERVRAISDLYSDEPRITVQSYSDLTIDFARRCGANIIVRGLRSVKDFEYERDVASMNHKLGGIDTIILFCEEQYAYISSSVVRELIKYGKDVSEFLPKKKK